MTPVSDLTANRVVFRSSDTARKLGAAAALLGAAAIAAPFCLPGVHRIQFWLLLLIGAVFSVAGLMLVLWQEELDWDFRGKRYEYRRGLRPTGRKAVGNISDFNGVTLQLVPSSNVYGEETVSGAIHLNTVLKDVRPVIRVEESDARSLALRLADAIRSNVDFANHEQNRSRTRSILKTAAAWSGWVGMIAVATIVVWTGLHRPHGRRFSSQGGFLGMGRANLTNDYQIGVDLYFKKDYKGAEQALKRAVKQLNIFADAYNELAYALVEQGKMDEALQAANNALAQSPNSGDILDTVAEMHQRRREFKEAANYYERALRQPMSQGPCQTHEKYGETLLALGRKKEAIMHLEAAIGDTIRGNEEWHDKAAAALAKIQGKPAPPPTARRMRSGPMAPM